MRIASKARRGLVIATGLVSVLVAAPLAAFAAVTVNAPGDIVTVTNPGFVNSLDGDPVRLQVIATDSVPGEQLSYKCLDIPGTEPAAGTNLVIWDCTSALGAGWHVQ